jgi:hypothetical protein
MYNVHAAAAPGRFHDHIRPIAGFSSKTNREQPPSISAEYNEKLVAAARGSLH